MDLGTHTNALTVSSGRALRHALAVGAALLVFPAVACGPVAQQVPDIAIDSAGVRIVTSDPANSDAACAISSEPTAVIGEDEGDETSGSHRSGAPAACRTGRSWR